ncbi:hypothetical protein I302_107997 [Kwoniella bestiolae CBS 10118]|uniref:Zn(2)-C6 fungal-type domain-containing protein n=1 Tax=Kwoniella bestiolae CBS 10118 TaxID=1296100 RepID=A0A1B9FWZ1_9TREE|nr:hypothetical protein I302_07638 [Kwoniella bestiolae CBS 10118]OCF23284.1 hypothetical protein I302_07638 [Kwoniella bestiolae CBS 10118]
MSSIVASSSSDPSSLRKRASKACSRCRRYRTKCVPLRPDAVGEPPCESCRALGVEHECTFLPRGQSALDRSHRRRPLRDPTSEYASSQHSRSLSPQHHRLASHNHLPISPITSPSPPRTNNTSLPPPSEVIEAIRHYVSSYFQLGFLHKALFVERYTSHPESVSQFLLLAICSIAAPFTPTLVSRYGGKKRATDFFLGKADEILGREMVRPSLERAQAFLLLGVTEWGQGNGPKAWMLIGTAVRMAGFLGLHRESTYQLPPNPSAEEVIESEVARRTFWAITCHENLLAGQSRPMQISLAEVDVLLPCEESEFNFGIQPKNRASIAGALGTSPDSFDTSSQGDKSLFASLVQVKLLWSLTARHACRGSGRFEVGVWSPASQSLLTALQDFEASLPVKHRFSLTNLRGMMVEGLDLAFLSITLITRLSNIVIRRLYLPSMAAAIDPDGPTEGSLESRHFWQTMANDMIMNSEQLLSQVETFFSMRSVHLGFPPIMVFGVYMCGNVWSYLRKWPELCLGRANTAERSYERCVEILSQLSDSWPLASTWHVALKSASTGPVRQAGYTRIRTAVQDERTLDDEFADIYGQSAPSIVGSSPGDRDLHGRGMAGPHIPAGTGPSIPLSSGGGSTGGTGAGQVALNGNQQYGNGNNVDLFNFNDSIQATTGRSTQMDDMNGFNGSFFMDNFGDELSAFLQSAVPTNEGSDVDGIGQFLFGDLGNGV